MHQPSENRFMNAVNPHSHHATHLYNFPVHVITQCVKVYEIFCRVSKQFDELHAYYNWGKDVGIARTSEYPEVERISPKKLELMDQFIRDKAANAQTRRLAATGASDEEEEEEAAENSVAKDPGIVEEDLNHIKALPSPEDFAVDEGKKKTEKGQQREADLLNLGNDAVSSEQQGDKPPLALFGFGAAAPAGPPPPPAWQAFGDSSAWEMALIESTSYLPHQKAELGGGLDMMLLDGLYQQGAVAAAANSGGKGSASSMVFGSEGHPPLQTLTLPAPAPREGEGGALPTAASADPFAASVGVAPPSYVQMIEMEKKQKLLVEEQMMWQQYPRP